MEDYIKKCIQDHRNPMVKLTLPAQKLFFAAKTEDEKAMINLYQENMKIALEHQRVEKRSGRAHAIWQPELGKALVTKVVKNIVKFFGTQDKTGIFLHPEEMLYLLETNRLEVTFNNTQLSIEKGYKLVLDRISLEQYRAYKKLALRGYKLVRYKSVNKKRALEGANEAVVSKKPKDGCAIELRESEVLKTTQFIENLFKEIRAKMPQEGDYETTCLTKPDYCIFKPKSASTSKDKPDFNLFICKNNELPFEAHCSCKFPHIYAICNDDVTFHAIGNVHVPYI